MKGYLLFKDGHREPMEDRYVGCLNYIRPRNENGRILETTFTAEDDVVDGCIVYREGETVDKTEAYNEAARKNREQTAKVFQAGLDALAKERE
jgi:hypothetical protein